MKNIFKKFFACWILAFGILGLAKNCYAVDPVAGRARLVELQQETKSSALVTIIQQIDHRIRVLANILTDVFPRMDNERRNRSLERCDFVRVNFLWSTGGRKIYYKT